MFRKSLGAPDNCTDTSERQKKQQDCGHNARVPCISLGVAAFEAKVEDGLDPCDVGEFGRCKGLLRFAADIAGQRDAALIDARKDGRADEGVFVMEDLLHLVLDLPVGLLRGFVCLGRKRRDYGNGESAS